ncbi:MAG: SCP2 sterol-binding domain-containing protein [Proteobacteria bacterium]|nr:SCP2 sterol-binding domain-containing protein [Pseudomonadota bacterium]MCP4920770.1 SCP2 sterol-binding domain-containing protein [Pseudomonadota bacterium]
MADTAGFFAEYLPNKIAADPSLKDIGKSFLFDIEGAGKWKLDLADGSITKDAEDGDCVITCSKDDWEKMLDNPSLAMQLFMMGKLKASDLGLATQLQRILG